MTMNQHEFLAWLEGFNAALGGATPTSEQWKQVLAKAQAMKNPYSMFVGMPPSKLGPAVGQQGGI
jgi:hypothetical protein